MKVDKVVVLLDIQTSEWQAGGKGRETGEREREKEKEREREREEDSGEREGCRRVLKPRLYLHFILMRSLLLPHKGQYMYCDKGLSLTLEGSLGLFVCQVHISDTTYGQFTVDRQKRRSSEGAIRVD
jgi:hypothetical protein